MAEINTSKQLLNEVKEKIKELEIIKDALERPDFKNDEFESYKKRFYELVNYPKKGN